MIRNIYLFWNRKVKRGMRTAYTRAANTYLRSNLFFQSWKKNVIHWRQSKPCTHMANIVHVAVHMASYLFPHSQPRLECTSICFTRLKTILDARWMWIQHGSPEPMMVFMYGSSWHSLPPRVAWTLWTSFISSTEQVCILWLCVFQAYMLYVLTVHKHKHTCTQIEQYKQNTVSHRQSHRMPFNKYTVCKKWLFGAVNIV